MKKLLTASIIIALAGCASQNHPTSTTTNHTINHEAVVLPSIAQTDTLQDRSAKFAALQVAPMAKMANTNLYNQSYEIQNTPITDTSRYQHLDINPVHEVAKSPISTFSIDVDTGSYANVRRFLNDGRLPPKDAVRAEEFINYFDYAYPAPTDGKPFAVQTAVMDSPFKDGAKLIRIGIKGKELAAAKLPPANLVFLVDVSGSMASDDKLGLVKHTLRTLTQKLRPTDTISIITYASGEKLVLEPTAGTDENKDKILRIINELHANGATAGEQAIQLAYKQAEQSFKKDGINRILLLTDGDFNVGITDFEQLKSLVAEKRKSGVSLSTFGFGQSNYNERLMEQMADAGDGNYSYIDNKNEAKKVLNRELSSTLATIAQDVKLQVEFNPATVKEYRLIGYENRALNNEDFNNDKVDAGDIGAGHSVTAIYEIVPMGATGWLNESRYQPTPTPQGKKDEYAHLNIRYKLPNGKASELMSFPISTKSVAFDKADNDSKWATLVAAFAQNLQGGQYTGNMDYKAIINTATPLSGNDPYGDKAEFLELVKIANSLSSKPLQ